MPHRPIVPALLAALLAACTAPPPARGPARSGQATDLPNPFPPEAIVIHPLTRAERDPQGRPVIMCHIEFRDAWGDTVKAAGTLQVQLYRPVGAGDIGQQELVWPIPLNDLDANAGFFDPATRTYRLPLEDAPEWVIPPEPGTTAGPARRIKLRAVFEGLDAHAHPLTLQDEYVFEVERGP